MAIQHGLPADHELSGREAFLVAFIGVFVALGLGAVAAFLYVTNLTNVHELVLPLLLTVGLVLLVATLAGYALVLHGAGLSNGAASEALGLPEGSVRAVLALALVLVFAILSVFLFLQMQTPPTLVSHGLTAEQIALMAPGQVIQVVAETATSPKTFTVFTTPAAPGASQVAQQLVTVLATLVTAVAAFYFGASTVKDANKQAEALRNPDGADAAARGTINTTSATRVETSAPEVAERAAAMAASNAADPASDVRSPDATRVPLR